MQAPRPLGLTLVLAIVGLAAFFSGMNAWAQRAQHMARYPLLNDTRLYCILALTALTLLGLLGIVRWRRWGLYLYGIASAALFGLEFLAYSGNPKSARTLLALILVGMNALPLWWRFR